MDEQRDVLLLILLSLSAGKIFYLSYDIISLLLLKSRDIIIIMI